MLDATAKIPSGLLNGNINWVGNYKQCNAVSQSNLTLDGINILPELRGRYCRANIGFPVAALAQTLPISDDFGLQVGMCFSEACENQQIGTIVANCKF